MIGAFGGAILANALPDQSDRIAAFATVGALAAPTALLLTPTRGSLRFRAVRYGLALAVLVSLAASFLAGADGLLVDELLGLGALVFTIGALGHGVLSVSLDRFDNDVGDASPPSPGTSPGTGPGTGPGTSEDSS